MARFGAHSILPNPQSSSLSYLSHHSLCVHPTLLLSIHLFAMPLQSKFIPPSSEEDEPSTFHAGSFHAWSRSPPADNEDDTAFSECEPGASILSTRWSRSKSTVNHYSGLSGSASGYISKSRPSASSDHRRRLHNFASQKKQCSPSLPSDEDRDAEDTELLELCAENEQLKQKLERSKGHLEAISCVPFLLLLSMRYLQSCQGRIPHPPRGYEREDPRNQGRRQEDG